LSRSKVPPHQLQPGYYNDPIQLYRDNADVLTFLAPIAERILCVCPTAAGSERNWSTFKHVWSDTRNSLLLGRVGLLVYIYYNTRVLSREAEAADWEAFISMMADTPAIPELSRLGARISDANIAAAAAAPAGTPVAAGSGAGADEEGDESDIIIK
jgi:hypothetical protein